MKSLNLSRLCFSVPVVFDRTCEELHPTARIDRSVLAQYGGQVAIEHPYYPYRDGEEIDCTCLFPEAGITCRPNEIFEAIKAEGFRLGSFIELTWAAKAAIDVTRFVAAGSIVEPSYGPGLGRLFTSASDIGLPAIAFKPISEALIPDPTLGIALLVFPKSQPLPRMKVRASEMRGAA
ncbi:MAG: hypothetical protein KGI79_01075 [Patescibacteria group bacterium]|nr:hypothetical protein [Patescibacteria group bacterium]MDE2116449.1 hypothetical protein [Patescibacteria group bacterium]